MTAERTWPEGFTPHPDTPAHFAHVFAMELPRVPRKIVLGRSDYGVGESDQGTVQLGYTQ